MTSPADVLAIRREMRVSRTQFALLVGVNRSTVLKWERGLIGVAERSRRTMDVLLSRYRMGSAGVPAPPL